jgi:hypothetical protein
MQELRGQSEKGKARLVVLNAMDAGLMRVQLKHPESSAGAAIVVELASLRDAMRAGGRRMLSGRAPSSGGPLVIERKKDIRDEYFLWIQNVGDNGWSIFVGAWELERALEDELDSKEPAASDPDNAGASG